MEKEKVSRPYIFMIDDSHILLMELAFRNALLIKASFRHLLVTYGNWRPTQWSNVSAIYAGHVLSSVSSVISHEINDSQTISIQSFVD